MDFERAAAAAVVVGFVIAIGVALTQRTAEAKTPTVVRANAIEIVDFCPRYRRRNRTYRPMAFARIVRPLRGAPRIRVRLTPATDWGAIAALYARLGAEERDLAERRAAGQTWPEIAVAVGGTAQARRKQLARAIDHLAPELGLDPEDDADE